MMRWSCQKLRVGTFDLDIHLIVGGDRPAPHAAHGIRSPLDALRHKRSCVSSLSAFDKIADTPMII